MCRFLRIASWSVGLVALVGTMGLLSFTGCGSGGSGWEFIGSPFFYLGSAQATGPSNTGQTRGSALSQSNREPVDPCTITQASRKFVTITMRNLTPDYIQYFFVAIAFVAPDPEDENAVIPALDDTPFREGAVCKADIPLYTQFGYIEIQSGDSKPFGDYCIHGPALYYFHRNGQFRSSIGTSSSGLGSAIAPAQGTSATYDNFFTSSGAQIPVPDLILFHNPGTGEGARLKISRRADAPCGGAGLGVAAAPVCQRDAWYYVDEQGIMAGSTNSGSGSGRRLPDEIQGTGCECAGSSEAYQILAPPGVTANGARCNEFLRGGRIEYAFLRQDENPPFPQLVWRVADFAGEVVHQFDAHAGIP